MNGKVIRGIGKTATGSIEMIKSVDSKFDIIRNMEKILKEAVNTPSKINMDESSDSDGSVSVVTAEEGKDDHDDNDKDGSMSLLNKKKLIDGRVEYDP